MSKCQWCETWKTFAKMLLESNSVKEEQVNKMAKLLEEMLMNMETDKRGD